MVEKKREILDTDWNNNKQIIGCHASEFGPLKYI